MVRYFNNNEKAVGQQKKIIYDPKKSFATAYKLIQNIQNMFQINCTHAINLVFINVLI